MKLLCFSVLDKAVGAYLPPFYSRSKGEAIRSFNDAAWDDKHQFAKHAADYILYECGSFDDHTGIFACIEPARVISAQECLLSSEE